MTFYPQEIWARLAAIPSYSGRWGMSLTCFIAFGWSVALWNQSPYVAVSPGFSLLLVYLPFWVPASAMLAVAIVPIVGIGINSGCLRALGTYLGLSAWIYLLVLSIISQRGYFSFTPGMGVYIASVLACVNADYRYWVARRKRLYLNTDE